MSQKKFERKQFEALWLSTCFIITLLTPILIYISQMSQDRITNITSAGSLPQCRFKI